MLGAILVPGSRRQECSLARKVAAILPRIIPGFGSSDCGCEGHLFYAGPSFSAAGQPLNMPFLWGF